MFRRSLASLGIASVLVLVWALAPSTTASPVGRVLPTLASYSPDDGAIFNNPWGTHSQKYAVISHFKRAIRSTPPGETIRVVTWRLNEPKVTTDLINAHKRGVDVQMLIHHEKRSYQLPRLRREIGSNRNRSSFAYACRNGCRSSVPAALHSKFFTFTQSGSSRRVVMVTSSNLTTAHAKEGWNDVYTSVDRGKAYRAYNRLFEEMKADPPGGYDDPYRIVDDGRFKSYYFPRPGDGKRTDTINKELSRVECHGARGRAGTKDGRTIVRVAMFHWDNKRGVYLARHLWRLDDRGCSVRVIVGAPARDVMRVLRRRSSHGGITLYDSRFDRDGDGVPDRYVHLKSMMISGHFGRDRSHWKIYTGSQNWTVGALRTGDEIVFRADGRGVHGRYASHFNRIRKVGTRKVPTAGARLFQPLPTFSTKLPEPN